MRVTRAYFKMCDDIPDIRTLQRARQPITEYKFETYLDFYGKRFFGRDRFDFAVWGSFGNNQGTRWSYKAYADENGRLRETGARGSIQFTNRVTEGSHGDVPFQRFRDAFLGGPKQSDKPILTEARSPLFSIVDHNSAHHMAYVLANKSFLGKDTRRVVINFDNHKDYEIFNQAADSICCQNWGQALRPRPGDRTVTRDHSVTRHIVLGLGDRENVVSWGRNGVKYQATVDLGKEVMMANALRKCLQLGESLENYHFHITVDRDFMKGTYTPYGDGPHHPEEGRRMVLQCLNYLKKRKANLAGFDITGLPCGGSYWYNQIMEQIYLNWVARNNMGAVYMRDNNIPPDFITKVHNICQTLNIPRRAVAEDVKYQFLYKIGLALTFEQLCDDVRIFYDAVAAY